MRGIRARWLTAMSHFEYNRKRVKTSKTYLLSGIKRKINTELRMKREKRGTCGDAGWTEGFAHSVTPKRHRCQSHTHDPFSKHIPVAEEAMVEKNPTFFPLM